MRSYQSRFGECVNGVCEISTTRQSAITGLLSVGAVIGAVGSGSIANKVSLAIRLHQSSLLTVSSVCDSHVLPLSVSI